MKHKTFMWKPRQTCGDKNPRGLRPTNLNP